MESDQNTQSLQSQPSITKPIKAVLPKNKLAPLFKNILPIIIIVGIVGVGILTGLVLTSRNQNAAQGKSKTSINQESLSGEQKKSFAQTFKDEAEGVVEKNDKLDKYAQGTHKLIRPGGENQTAYLTSSVLDLDEYVGKKVKVYGETFGSSQVGWLMDVGKVEVIN